MPKKKFKKQRKIVNDEGLIVSENQTRRRDYRVFYRDKYFNKFLARFEYGGISYQQFAYIMRKFWGRGTVGCGLDKLADELFFAPYAPSGKWNTYDYPVGVYFINVRNVSFIPKEEQIVDESAVIGYIQKNRKPVFELINVLIEKLVDIEMTIYVNLKAQKNPLVIGVSPEDEEKKQKLIEQYDEDNPFLFVGLQDIALAKAFVSGANYNLDKLEQQKQLIDNEILTLLGINNIGSMEKKEHFTVNEVDANNQMIETSSNEFDECLDEFFSQVKEVFNKDAFIRTKKVEISSDMSYNESEEEEYARDE